MKHRSVVARRFTPAALALALLAASTPPAQALLLDDDEKERAQIEWPDPAPATPDLNELIEYTPLSAARGQRYAFDPASLTVVDKTGVRFTLVIFSSSGTPNISHEAFRCTSTERKQLAIGHRDGQWSPTPKTEWQKLDVYNYASPYLKPLYDALCSGGLPVTKLADIRRRLEEAGQRY